MGNGKRGYFKRKRGKGKRTQRKRKVHKGGKEGVELEEEVGRGRCRD